MKTISNKKVKDACSHIIQNHAFFASMMLQQNIIEDNSENNPTFYVDGENLAYNSSFADSLSFNKVVGVLVHEIFHLTLGHHIRKGSRDNKLWNEACDYVVNYELIKSGFELPDDLLYDVKYQGMSAEEVYRLLDIKDKKEQEKNGGKKKDSKGDKKSFGEVREAKEKNAEEKAKIQTKQAQSIAKAAGELPSGTILEMIGAANKPKFDWRTIINQFVSEIVAKDYSFERADNRFLHNGIIIPDLYSKAVANIVIAIDTSGSVNLDDVKKIVTEAKYCLDVMSEDKDNATLHVIYCDAEVQGVDIFDGSDIKPNPKGGGGTRFSPVFKYIEQNDLMCDGLIYITDGYCYDFGNIIPEYRVLWGLTLNNNYFKPPFGEVFDFNIGD